MGSKSATDDTATICFEMLIAKAERQLDDSEKGCVSLTEKQVV